MRKNKKYVTVKYLFMFKITVTSIWLFTPTLRNVHENHL